MRRTNLDLGLEVAALGDLSREELAARWRKAHGHAPPKGIRHELLVRSASWHMQEQRLGGLSATARRALKAATADVEQQFAAKCSISAADWVRIDRSGKAEGELCRAVDGSVGNETIGDGREPPSFAIARATSASVPARRRQTVSPGARLVRDWHGETHVVDVIEEGFVFQAKVHKSLTAIAHQITGAHWSGPRFFGI